MSLGQFGGQFRMTRHRFQDITNCFSFTVPHNGVDAKVSGLLYQFVSVFIIYLIYKTHGKTPTYH